MEENNKPITNIKELKKYIGKYVASEITYSYNNKENTIVWIQKLNKIPKCYGDNESTKGISVCGDCVTEIKPRCCKIYGNIKNYITCTQDFFRKPTKQEMNIYRNFWRKYRIFGTIPNDGY